MYKIYFITGSCNMIFFLFIFCFLIKNYCGYFGEGVYINCWYFPIRFMKSLHMLHGLTNPTGSVYFLWTKSLDGTSLHVKWRLQENPPTWYPPFLEYSRVSASMASTIGQTTLLGNSLIRDKIGSSLRGSTKGNNSSKRKGVAYSLLPLIKWLTWSLTPVHGVWNHWNLFVCIQASLLQAISKIRTNQKGMLKKSGFYIHSLPLG